MSIFRWPYDNTQVTLELRELIENGVNIWDFEYPTFYEGDEKKAFEQKVIDHYYFRQIGQETPGRWLHYFRSRMREIMPYYIQLYETVKIMEELPNPFDNVDIIETFERETTAEKSGNITNEDSGTESIENSGTMSGETSGTSDTTNNGTSSGTDKETRTHTENHTRKFSNTPQGNITNLENYMTEANVETADDGDSLDKTSSATTSATSKGTASGTEKQNTTATEERSSSSTGKTTSKDNETQKETHTFTKKGNQGVNTYAHDMLEYRQTLLNIDMQIIHELKDLFIQVY